MPVEAGIGKPRTSDFRAWARYCLANFQLEPRACVSHDLLGNVDEHPVRVGLLLVTLPRRHALDLVHPPPRRACAVAKPLDLS